MDNVWKSKGKTLATEIYRLRISKQILRLHHIRNFKINADGTVIDSFVAMTEEGWPKNVVN